jgi:hypothetical protein
MSRAAQRSIVRWLFVSNRESLGLQCFVSIAESLDRHFSDFIEPF